MPTTTEIHSIQQESNKTHYEILGIQSNATDPEITKAFRILAASNHPDRGGNSELFTQITESYDILSNPVQRALYDLDIGITPETPETMHKIHCLRRQAAMRELRNMIEKSKQIALIEQQRNGLVIIDAKYGDIQGLNSKNNNINNNNHNKHNEINILDVTIQLQSFVSDSMILLREGQSKSWIEGFYDVCEGKKENNLQIIYKLGGKLHSIIVGEYEELVIPQEIHQMNSIEINNFENTIFKNKKQRLNNIKMKRRIILYSTLAVAGLGIYYFSYGKKNGFQLPGSNYFNKWIETLTEWTKFWKTNSNSNNSNNNINTSSSRVVNLNDSIRSSSSSSNLLSTNSALFKDQFIQPIPTINTGFIKQ